MRRIAAIMLALAIVTAISLLGYGIYVFRGGEQSAGIALSAGGLLALALGVLLYSQFVLIHKFEGNTYRLYDAILDSYETLRRQTDLIHTIAENASMSDWVKAVVHHEKDHEFLRDTIHGSIVRQDWEAAEHLIQALDEQLGYHDEAVELREEIQRARDATQEEKIERAIKRFDKLCHAQKWNQAARETARLQKLFPESDRIGNLAGELDLRQHEYKRNLLKEYDLAARNNDVEKAHKLLVELDQYLAPNEAAALKDSARGVFKAKLMQMGVQFNLAVSDKQISSAVDIGERIVREFPNSRYAKEIADMLPHLKKRLAHERT
jgi:hypothetical protein